MYCTKFIDKSAPEPILYQCTWLFRDTVRYNELRILKGAVLTAEPGKFLTLTVDGVGRDIVPGLYKGDVVLSVTDAYTMEPHGLLRSCGISRGIHAAAVIENGKLSRGKCVSAFLSHGSITDSAAEDLYISSTEESFNGFVVAGDTEYLIKNVKVDFEGEGDNDFLGVGCAVTAVDSSKVTIDSCDFTLSGITRCAVHAGGNSFVHVKNSRITNLSPASEKLGSFSWQIGLYGTHRLLQLADAANVMYENCELKSNGWGVCSIDGTTESVSMVIKDSRIELSGPHSHGYGAFCIGENQVIFDNCDINVTGYPLMLMGMEGLGRAAIKSCRVDGRRFGVFIVGDDNSVLDINDSSFDTWGSTLCIKGSSTVVNIQNTEMRPGNGTVVQLMDTEESGMNVTAFHVPVGIVDTVLDGRDITAVSPTEDVTLNIADSRLEGNIFNSTTNIRAYKNNEYGVKSDFQDSTLGVKRSAADEANRANNIMSTAMGRHNGDDLRGPKNLGVDLKNSHITGVISAATQRYRDGVTVIDEKNRRELSNVIQSAAPPLNNGVCVALDAQSSWTVTGESFVTSLSLEDGAVIKAADGKNLVMTVNGKAVPIMPGLYKGCIRLETR